MSYDGSLASNIEAWLIETIGGLSQVGTGNVELFAGIQDLESTLSLLEELRGNRIPFVAVEARGSPSRDLEEGDFDAELDFTIWIVVENSQPAVSGAAAGTAARCGQSASVPGTNLLAEVIRNAVHNAEPGVSSTLMNADRVRVTGWQSIYDPKNISIVEMKVSVRESEKTT